MPSASILTRIAWLEHVEITLLLKIEEVTEDVGHRFGIRVGESEHTDVLIARWSKQSRSRIMLSINCIASRGRTDHDGVGAHVRSETDRFTNGRGDFGASLRFPLPMSPSIFCR